MVQVGTEDYDDGWCRDKWREPPNSMMKCKCGRLPETCGGRAERGRQVDGADLSAGSADEAGSWALGVHSLWRAAARSACCLDARAVVGCSELSGGGGQDARPRARRVAVRSFGAVIACSCVTQRRRSVHLSDPAPLWSVAGSSPRTRQRCIGPCSAPFSARQARASRASEQAELSAIPSCGRPPFSARRNLRIHVQSSWRPMAGSATGRRLCGCGAGVAMIGGYRTAKDTTPARSAIKLSPGLVKPLPVRASPNRQPAPGDG